MNNWFGRLIGQSKEWCVRQAAFIAAAKYLAPYGEMTSFHIDPKNKKITVSLELRGEQSPIDAEVGYDLQENSGNLNIRITEIKTSREWLTELANEALKRFPNGFEIPPGSPSSFVKLAGR